MFPVSHCTPPSLFISECGPDICHHYCVNSKACTLSSSGYVECVCPARYEGNKCEVDKCLRCHGAPCLINEETGDVVCKWVLDICLLSSSIAAPTACRLDALIWLNLQNLLGHTPWSNSVSGNVSEFTEARWTLLLDMNYAHVWQSHHWVIALIKV